MAKTIKKGGTKSELPNNQQNNNNTGSEKSLDDKDLTNDDSAVSKEEAQLLARSADSQAGEEDNAWNESALDNVDEDGDPLNEENEFSGKDLDVPGSEDDDDNEKIGEEDEENNSYSLGGDKD